MKILKTVCLYFCFQHYLLSKIKQIDVILSQMVYETPLLHLVAEILRHKTHAWCDQIISRLNFFFPP
jgi:hypothetical protein